MLYPSFIRNWSTKFSTYTNSNTYTKTCSSIERAITIRPDSYYNSDFFDIEEFPEASFSINGSYNFFII